MSNSTLTEMSSHNQREKAIVALEKMKALEKKMKKKLTAVKVVKGYALSVDQSKYKDYKFEGNIGNY